MNGVIIACRDAGMGEKLAQVVSSSGIRVLGTVTKGASALHLASRFSGDGGVLLCTYAMSDMTVMELFQIRPEHFEMVVLLSARQRAMVRGEGMICLDIPLNRRDLIETLALLLERGWHDHKPETKEQRPAPRSKADNDLIDRAKALLMERNNMTEPEAHRFMQKKSMDTGDSLVAVAEKILNGVL